MGAQHDGRANARKLAAARQGQNAEEANPERPRRVLLLPCWVWLMEMINALPAKPDRSSGRHKEH